MLRRHGVLFKAPSELDLLMQINSGLHYTQIGKFITVYCLDDRQTVAVAADLRRAARGLDGPEVPFDLPLGRDCPVYARYGSFIDAGRPDRGGTIRDRKGRWQPDDRTVAVPTWLTPPFPLLPPPSTSALGLLGNDCIVFRSLSQRGKGGVYEALDLSLKRGRLCIVKEGRRHGETFWDGSDGRERLDHELKVLAALSRAGIAVPEVLRTLVQDRNRYVVFAKLPGRTLLPRNSMTVPRPSWSAAARLYQRLGSLLGRIHAAGWVWRDCKPDNIFSWHGQLTPIDLEGACRPWDVDKAPWGALQYTPDKIYRSLRRPAGYAEDLFALGVIVFQFGTGLLPPANRGERRRILRQTSCPAQLAEMLVRLLEGEAVGALSAPWREAPGSPGGSAAARPATGSGNKPRPPSRSAWRCR